MRVESCSAVESDERCLENLDMGWLGFVEGWRVRLDDRQREVYLGLERPFVEVLVGHSLHRWLVYDWKSHFTDLISLSGL